MEASGITSIKCFKKYCALKTVYLAKLSFNNGGENNNLYKKQEHEEFTETFSERTYKGFSSRSRKMIPEKEVEMQK